MVKTGIGTCPKCGSDNIDYYDHDHDFDTLVHYCECQDCHLRFLEFEKTIYDGYAYDGEDGEYHDFDANGDEIGK